MLPTTLSSPSPFWACPSPPRASPVACRQGLSLPVGNLKDKSGYGTNQFFGAHVGGHIDFNLTSHHQVRGQLTYHDLPGSGWGGFGRCPE